MSFLAPLFLAGAAAIALPILFHLIRQTPKERIPFSSLMFLKPALPKVSKKNRIDNMFLLLLRCLVLVLLALAFARPYFRSDLPITPSSKVPRKVAVIVDVSASMRRDHLWRDAKAAVETELKKAGGQDQCSLAVFDTQVRTLITFEQWASMPEGGRISAAKTKLEEITPGWFGTHIGAALLGAVEKFDAKSENATPTEHEIVLISDLQEGARLDGLQGYQWPKGLRVSITALKPAHQGNASIQLSTQETDATTKLRVSHLAGGRKDQFRIGVAELSGNAFSGWNDEVYVPAGQSRVFPVSSNVPFATAHKFLLKGDEDEFDNAAYVVTARTNMVEVAFLGEPEKDATQPLFFLRPVFRQERRENTILKTISLKTSLDAEALRKIVMLVASERLPDAHLPVLRDWLKSGKVLLFALHDAGSMASLAALAELDPGNLTATPEPKANLILAQIDFQHPLFAPFADPRYSDFSKIHFWSHLKTKLPDAVPVLARFDNGDAALAEIKVGNGRIFLLTSGWEPAESQLALSSKFVPLLYSMLDLSGKPAQTIESYTIGDQVPLPASATNLIVRKPDNSSAPLSKTNLFAGTDIPGIYTINTQPPILFAVNLDARESKTTAVGVDELERLGLPLKEQVLSKSAVEEKKAKQKLVAVELEGRQKLWRWFLVLALLFVLGESVLAAYLTRRALQPASA